MKNLLVFLYVFLLPRAAHNNHKDLFLTIWILLILDQTQWVHLLLFLFEIVLQFFLKLDLQHIFLLESIGYLHLFEGMVQIDRSFLQCLLSFQLEEELYKLVVYLLFPLAFSQALKIVHHHDKNYV